jgi:hypothetical protein
VPEPDLAVKQLLEQETASAAGFFERAEMEVLTPTSVGFRALFASVPRRLGQGGQQSLGQRSARLAAARPHWTRTDLTRLWLLLRGLSGLARAQQPGWLLALFEAGEIGEPARFVETGEQACRHNSLDVFEAIVAENPFLSEHFPALSFNQAVIKAIFMQVSLQRIERLEQRITPELSRLAAGFVSERRAAGRPVPEDAEYLAHYGAK